MNSWIIGFFPTHSPRYAFAAVLERAPAGTAVGAPAAMRVFFDWLALHKPEYLLAGS
jgi:cell division protein FtsI/penicillin-binding protein 2